MNERVHRKALQIAAELADDHVSDESLLLATIIMQLADIAESLDS